MEDDVTRGEITALCKSEVLGPAAALFGATQDALRLYDPYEGCQNLVYDYERDGRPMILRISYRPDRSVGQIRAEVHFVNYLGDHGVRVARAQPSRQRNLVETLQAGGILFSVVCFEKGKGMRVPDNHYRYRENAPIEEYFQNWGQVLGQMHALTKTYRPISASVKRPTWFELEPSRGIDRVPDTLPRVRDKFERLLAQLRALPEDRDAYGLIHGDFNDGNFTVDYDNGDITVFDFDDACYFWFAYELACAWEGGIGRIMHRETAERRAFMNHYMEQVLE
jgi:Ser/Thr protein kinase RdoA (MazF antagonist)